MRACTASSPRPPASAFDRKTVREWRDRAREAGPPGLVPRYPERRSRRIPAEVVDLIAHARRDLQYGACRTRIWLLRVHQVKVAARTITRICDDLGLPRVQRPKRRRAGRQLKLFEKATPGESVQVDVKVVRLGSTKAYQYTACDDCTRFRVLRLYRQQNTFTSLDFLSEIVAAFPFPIRKLLTACYERFVNLGCRPRWAVRSSSSSGMTPRRGSQRASFGLHARGNEECRAEAIGLAPGGRPKTTVDMLLSPATPEPSRLRDTRHRTLPVVIELKRLPSTHDGEGIEQELVHARAERLHFRQRPVGPLDEAIVVRPDPWIVLEARQRRQVHDLAESGAAPATHHLAAAHRLARVPPRGIRAGELDELAPMPILRDGSDMGKEAGDASPAQAGDRPQVLGLFEPREQDIDLRGHRGHLGREHIDPRHRPLDFAGEDVEPIGTGDGLLRVAMDLGQFEAPDAAAGTVRADTGDELTEGQAGHRRGSQAGAQHGQGPWLQQIRPDPQEFREEPIELVRDQDFQPRPLLAEPSILTPGPPQRQVRTGLQLSPGDQARPAELGDLLGIGHIRLLAAELPRLADPEGRQRIDDHVPLAPRPEDIRHRFPHVPGRLEGEHAMSAGAPEGARQGAPEQFLEPHPRVRDSESRQPLTVSGQHHDLVLGACQVQADHHIITPEAASIVRHVGPSFVSEQTREGITRTRRRCRLPLSHTLILDNGSEFSFTFMLAVERRGIRHRYIKPRRPDQNGKVERSHRVDAEEFWGRHTFASFEAAAAALPEWEREYNDVRFSMALHGRTPAEKLAAVLGVAA